jgi:hypothetical protein
MNKRANTKSSKGRKRQQKVSKQRNSIVQGAGGGHLATTTFKSGCKSKR